MLDQRLDIGGLRVDEGDPLVHMPVVDPALDGAGGPGQLGPAVDPQERLPVRVDEGFHPPPLLPGNVNQVGEINFPGDRALGDFHQAINQKRRVKTISPGVDLPDGQEVGPVVRILGLDHRRHLARCVPHHPAVMGPVRQLDGLDGDRGPGAGMEPLQRRDTFPGNQRRIAAQDHDGRRPRPAPPAWPPGPRARCPTAAPG